MVSQMCQGIKHNKASFCIVALSCIKGILSHVSSLYSIRKAAIWGTNDERHHALQLGFAGATNFCPCNCVEALDLVQFKLSGKMLRRNYCMKGDEVKENSSTGRSTNQMRPLARFGQ